MSVPPGTIPFNHTRPTPIRAEDPNTRLQEGQYETSVPTVADRVVQAALKLVLEPIFDADFLPVSYGFRPERRAHDAIAEIHMFGTQGYRWVLDADIEAAFDRVSHSALLDRVRRRVKDKRVLALVKAASSAGPCVVVGRVGWWCPARRWSAPMAHAGTRRAPTWRC